MSLIPVYSSVVITPTSRSTELKYMRTEVHKDKIPIKKGGVGMEGTQTTSLPANLKFVNSTGMSAEKLCCRGYCLQGILFRGYCFL